MKPTIEVTDNVLIKRINRKLAPGDVLRTLRGERALNDLGRFYIVDTHTGSITAAHVDLGELAKELGVLREGERAEEGSR